MRKAKRLVGAVCAALLAGAASGVAGAAPRPHDEGRGRLDHIFVIMLENHSKDGVIGDPDAPRITRLARTYGMADHYFGVTHPSMPNYLAATAGDTFGIQDDEDENVTRLTARNVVDQLEEHGRTWAAYMEDLPTDKQARFGPVVNGSEVHLYARKHNPFVLFNDIADNPARMAAVRPYSALAADLASGDVPDFAWLTPNQCNDMHGGVDVAVPGHPETPCPYAGSPGDANDQALKGKADIWVQQAVDTITHSAAWKENSAIFIVADENDWIGGEDNGGYESADGCCDSPYVPLHDVRLNPDYPASTTPSNWPGGIYGGGLSPAVVITSRGPRGAVSHTPYNHYSLLRTVQDNWRLGHLRYSGDTEGGVLPMRDLLTRR